MTGSQAETVLQSLSSLTGSGSGGGGAGSTAQGSANWQTSQTILQNSLSVLQEQGG